MAVKRGEPIRTPHGVIYASGGGKVVERSDGEIYESAAAAVRAFPNPHRDASQGPDCKRKAYNLDAVRAVTICKACRTGGHAFGFRWKYRDESDELRSERAKAAMAPKAARWSRVCAFARAELENRASHLAALSDDDLAVLGDALRNAYVAVAKPEREAQERRQREREQQEERWREAAAEERRTTLLAAFARSAVAETQGDIDRAIRWPHWQAYNFSLDEIGLAIVDELERMGKPPLKPVGK